MQVNPIAALIFGVIVLVVIAVLIRTGHIGLLFFLLFNLMGGGGGRRIWRRRWRGRWGLAAADSEDLAAEVPAAGARVEVFRDSCRLQVAGCQLRAMRRGYGQ